MRSGACSGRGVFQTPGPLDDALGRSSSGSVRRWSSRARPTARAADVRLPAQKPARAAVVLGDFGYSALSQRYAARRPAARRDGPRHPRRLVPARRRHEEPGRAWPADEVIAFDDDELVLLSSARAHRRRPAAGGARPGPAPLRPRPRAPRRGERAALPVVGVLQRFVVELARVLLTARPPLELEQPARRLRRAGGWRACRCGWPERPVRESAGLRGVPCRRTRSRRSTPG